MLANRLISIGGLLLAAVLISLGTNVEYGQEAYQFPNVLGYCLVIFGLTLLVFDGDLSGWLKDTGNFLWRWLFDVVGANDPSRWPDVVRLIPAFVVILAYLYLADIVGLYTMSFLTFFSITVIYTPHRPRSKTLLKNLVIAALFISVIYLIFAVMLQLQSPQAWLL
ncbi:MAG: tripartite tricarboxylate transporter TctB family protein [Halopseudomonas sp.]